MEKKIDQLIGAIKELHAQVEKQDQKIKDLQKQLGVTVRQESAPEVPVVKKTQATLEQSKGFDWKGAELWLGKYGLQIAGAGIFLLGMVFFLTYVIAQGWISPIVRFATALGVATGLVIGAEFLQRVYRQWSTACFAAGVSLFYATFYAGCHYYQLYNVPTAFYLFCATTALSVVQAIRYSDRWLAWLSFIGAFLVPIFLGEINEPLVATYLLVVAAAFLSMSYARQWYALSYVSIAGIAFYHTFALAHLSLNGKLLFAVGFFVVYNIAPYLLVIIHKPKTRIFEPIIIGASGILMGLFLVGAFVYTNMVAPASYATTAQLISGLFAQAAYAQIIVYVALVGALSYAIKCVVLALIDKRNMYVVGTLYTLAVLYGALVIRYLLPGYVCAAAFALYALLLLGIGFYVKQFVARLYAYAAWVISLIILMRLGYHVSAVLDSLPSYYFFFGFDYMTWIIIITIASGAYLTNRYKSLLYADENRAPNFLQVIALTLGLWWINMSRMWPEIIWGDIVSWWYILAIFAVGLWRKWYVWRMVSYCFAALFALYMVAGHDYLFSTYGTTSVLYDMLIATLVAVFLGANWLCNYFEKHLIDTERRRVPAICKLVATVAVCVWGRATLIRYSQTQYMGWWQADTLKQGQLANVLLTIYYALYALVIIIIGLARHERLLRYFGLLLVVLTLAKLWLIVMGFAYTIYRIVAFIIIGLALIAASFIYQKLSRGVTQ